MLYQKNIEAVCSNEAEVRNQIRQTLTHELGHYFGMTEEQLKDVKRNAIGHWITHSPITSLDSSAAGRFANVRLP